MSWTPYCGGAPDPEGWLTQWNGDPVLISAMLLAALLGWRREPDRPAFAAGWMLLALLFVSPLCALTSALFSARVAHHVVMVGVAAPLLVRAFDLRAGALIPATAVSILIFYGWHWPAVYAAALSDDAVFWILQIALLASATWFWAAIHTAGAPAAVATLLVTMVAMGLLGALLTFAGNALYAPHLLTTYAWGLDPIEDQQLAGLIMWAPAAGLYLAAALGIAWRTLAPRSEEAAA
ncbi:cytochrome c oxidase assembly protein [Sphingomonas colocasiae]|uniref:Cytochrome c oxidase assembly protein n=1 Tax=Sphingomonas colocasiae TaxID=1848973 RepID=A0ABS7PSY5_9SPHN|nr:cytochrome c oxidase assembly protein [Sphingomonas colocasiae]MBY8823502.1 cytochrome c oxidase assembly protein [Sphingomonas colocasiae]